MIFLDADVFVILLLHPFFSTSHLTDMGTK